MGDEDDQGWKTVKGRKNKDHQRRLDITTAKRKFRDEPENITTYFFTDIPNSFGAKAMFNAFQYYGDVSEVVIPAKRDRGGRRFGFVRFNQVTDERRFEYELDKLIIGRNKITVNLSRFQRPAGVRRQDGRWEGEEYEACRSATYYPFIRSGAKRYGALKKGLYRGSCSTGNVLQYSRGFS
jgi:hypothetical protein